MNGVVINALQGPRVDLFQTTNNNPQDTETTTMAVYSEQNKSDIHNNNNNNNSIDKKQHHISMLIPVLGEVKKMLKVSELLQIELVYFFLPHTHIVYMYTYIYIQIFLINFNFNYPLLKPRGSYSWDSLAEWAAPPLPNTEPLQDFFLDQDQDQDSSSSSSSIDDTQPSPPPYELSLIAATATNPPTKSRPTTARPVNIEFTDELDELNDSYDENYPYLSDLVNVKDSKRTRSQSAGRARGNSNSNSSSDGYVMMNGVYVKDNCNKSLEVIAKEFSPSR